MRMIGYCVFAMICLLALRATPASAQQSILSNGMNVLVHEDNRFPLVSLRISVRTGSIDEKAKVAGLAHVLEHMVFKRTQKWANGTAAKKIEEVGGYLNAMTSFDYTTYLVDVPADKWKLGMEVLEQLVFKAVFDKDELEKEKLVVIEELKRGEDNPHNRIFKQVQAIALKGTPYARPIIGTEQTIHAITIEDLEEYRRINYQPQSMVITVVGNVKTDAVMNDIQQRFASYKNTRVITPRTPITREELPYGQFISMERAAWRKSYITLALPIPGYEDIRSVELDVLAGVLSGDLTAPLQKKYKYDLQLVDSFSIEPVSFRNVGLLYISAEADPNNVERFMKELLQDLSTIGTQRYTQSDVGKIQFRLEDSLVRSRATIAKLASLLNYFQLSSASPLAEENYLSIVKAVNAQDLPQVASTWIRPDQVTLVGILPSRSPEVDFKGLLKQYWPAKVQGKSAVAEKKAGTIERIELSDGKVVMLIPDSSLPYTSINIEYEGGMMLADTSTQGVETLTASMLTSGTKRYSALQIEEYQTSRSSSISASAGRTSFTIATSQPAQFTKDILVLLKEIIENPTFPDADVVKTKQNSIADIYSTLDNPTGLMFRELYPFLFPNQRYGEYLTGTPETIEKITRKEIEAFWKKQRAQKVVISVAGEFNKAEILEFVKNLPKSQKQSIVLPTVTWGSETKKMIAVPDRSQTHILLTYPTVDIYSKDTPALVLLQATLGGQSGVLFRELREKQALAYTVRAINTQGQRFGFFSYYIGTSPEKEAIARAGFENVIKQIVARPLSAKELEKGKRQIKEEYYRAMQSFGARASSISSNIIRALPADYNYQLVQSIEKLTPQEVHAVAKKYFGSKKSYLLIVHPSTGDE